MSEPAEIPKRHIPIGIAILILCLGGAGLLLSKVGGKIKEKYTRRVVQK